MPKQKSNIITFTPDETIIRKIYFIRGQKVMLDFDLAALYEVETRVFNQAIKRNSERFPIEFMFRLSAKEWQGMISQFVISSEQVSDAKENKKMQTQPTVTSLKKRKHTSYPFAFTEHGVAMVANVLKSERAVKMSIAIIKTFIQLRKHAIDYTQLIEQFEELKLRLGEHDVQLKNIYDTIENLMEDKVERQHVNNTRRRIGFRPDE